MLTNNHRKSPFLPNEGELYYFLKLIEKCFHLINNK